MSQLLIEIKKVTGLCSNFKSSVSLLSAVMNYISKQRKNLYREVFSAHPLGYIKSFWFLQGHYFDFIVQNIDIVAIADCWIVRYFGPY